MRQVQVPLGQSLQRDQEEPARIHQRAGIGANTSVWPQTAIREDARIGDNCIIGRAVYVDVGVIIGDRCKIQDGALLYSPAVVEDGVFIGPGAILTNDTHPRAINPDGSLKDSSDWDKQGVVVRKGASVGAGAIVMPGITVGRWSMIGAGAVVIEDVPDHALVVGVPARLVGWVGKSGRRLLEEDGSFLDPDSNERYVLGESGLAVES